MIIAQITDLHIALPGSEIDRTCRTAEHLERCVAHLMALEPRPQVVLATGDLVDAGTPAEYARLKAILRPLPMPVYLIPGNHDHRENLRAAFADHDYLPRTGRFLHYVVEGWPVRLIALDTVIAGEDGGELCDGRIAWLAERLREAPERPTLVFMHHPPFPTGIAAMDRYGFGRADALAVLLSRHPQIERVICGHVHRPIQVRWGGTAVSVAPATAHQVALNLAADAALAIVMEPPACQLHVWRPDTGLVTHTSYIGAYAAVS